MNKFIKITAVALVALMLAVTLCACNSSTTLPLIRWTDEELVYNISLADIYTTLTYDETSYTVDYDVNSYGDYVLDQVMPLAVNGTRTVKIETVNKAASEFADNAAFPDTFYKITNTTLANESYSPTSFSSQQTAESTYASVLVSADAFAIVLKTEIVSVTYFNESFKPIQSTKSVLTPYVGFSAQLVENYRLDVSYDYENLSISSTVTDLVTNAVTEQSAAMSESEVYYDNEQLFLAVRAFDQSDTAFENAVSLSIYDGVTNTVTALSLTLNRKVVRPLYNNRTNAYEFTEVNEMSATTTGFTIYLFNTCNDTDSFVKASNGRTVYRYSTVKFQQGFWSFVLDFTKTDANTSAIYNSLFVATESD